MTKQEFVDRVARKSRLTRRREMTKQEFVDRVARKSRLTRRDAARAVDAVLDTITEALRKGDSVSFTGFGKFSVRSREVRTGTNPRNPREKLHIPAARVPKFAAGSQLKRSIKRRALPGTPTVPWGGDVSERG